jgi:carbon monoxide dehydrogenase subunit G
MMKWVKRIGIGILVLIAAVFLLGMMLPSKYDVRRSVVIDAGPERVHEFVSDLRMWEAWMPWTDVDPTIRITYGETTSGVGASHSWSGKSGDGELTFTKSDPDDGVEYDMAFDGGSFASKGQLSYESAGNGTRVTWVMSGDVGGNVLQRYMLLGLDGAMGPMFESGLNKLKAKAEEPPPLPEEPLEGEAEAETATEG